MAVAGLRGVECDTGDTDDSLTMELVRITRGRGCRVITTTGGLLMALGVNTLRHSVPASISELSGGIRVIWRMLIRVTYWHYQYWYQSHVQSVPWGHVAMCQPQWARVSHCELRARERVWVLSDVIIRVPEIASITITRAISAQQEPALSAHREIKTVILHF